MTGEPSWIAGADGIAHARPRGARATRTACGERAIDERFAHPSRERCSACLAAIKRDEAPVT